MREATPPSAPPRWPITQLLLVRPGEVEDTSFFPDFTGHGDPRLTARGREQAEAIARRLGSHDGPPIMGLYTSPFAAAQTTAYILEILLGLPDSETDPALATIMPEQLPPGASGIDTLSMIAGRAWETVERLHEIHPPDASIALVTHDLPIRAMICRALGMAIEDSDRLRTEPGSISIIEFRGPRTLLHTLNDLCHLDAPRKADND